MFDIRQVSIPGEWEKFYLKQNETLLTQSEKYSLFYKKNGDDSWIIGIYFNNVLVGGSVAAGIKARRGNFIFLPYGPILPEENKESALIELTNFLVNFAKKNKYDFIRVSPYLDQNDQNLKMFKNSGYRKAPMHMLAETTWILDLSKSEEEILAQMEKGHRYLVRRCQKEQVIIKKSNVNDAEICLDEFNKLHDETAKRHNFHRFSQKFIDNEFFSFSSLDEALVISGYLPDKKIDSSALIFYYGNMAAYRHGASLGLNNKIPTSYLVQWEGILEAKKRGKKWYNFWGIAPANAPDDHPFKGITHFKKGFGGFQKDLLHCMDLPVGKKYWLNWIIETIRRKKRGFD